MDEFLQSLIAGAPNLAVALIVLLWQERRISRYEKFYRRIISHLLSLPDEKEVDNS